MVTQACVTGRHERVQAQPVDYNPARALQEENEWLRSALRMAESTIMRNRQEVSGVGCIHTHTHTHTMRNRQEVSGVGCIHTHTQRQTHHAQSSGGEWGRVRCVGRGRLGV
jgi:hypothetical protein